MSRIEANVNEYHSNFILLQLLVHIAVASFAAAQVDDEGRGSRRRLDAILDVKGLVEIASHAPVLAHELLYADCCFYALICGRARDVHGDERVDRQPRFNERWNGTGRRALHHRE